MNIAVYLSIDKAFVVSGKLNEIRHSGGHFQLVLKDGQTLPGHVHTEFLDEEYLRPLWGHDATVEGTVFFKANGKPRVIEARRIGAFQQGDQAFQNLPQIEPGTQQSLFPELVGKARKSDPMMLWGAWPVDEPIEELLADRNPSCLCPNRCMDARKRA